MSLCLGNLAERFVLATPKRNCDPNPWLFSE